MGIFDIFKGKKSESSDPNTGPASSEGSAPYYGDLEKTEVLRNLFLTPANKRDDAWRLTFYNNVLDASFQADEPATAKGPDGFPYFRMSLPNPGTSFQCYVLRHMKDDFLLENGMGVVIHAEQAKPDWVFRYGDIVNLELNNELYSQPGTWGILTDDDFDHAYLASQPSEQLLPKRVRSLMREHCSRWGIKDPKVILFTIAGPGFQKMQLGFNTTPDRFANEQQWQTFMSGLRWHMPYHYTAMTMPESPFTAQYAPL